MIGCMRGLAFIASLVVTVKVHFRPGGAISSTVQPTAAKQLIDELKSLTGANRLQSSLSMTFLRYGAMTRDFAQSVKLHFCTLPAALDLLGECMTMEKRCTRSSRI